MSINKTPSTDGNVDRVYFFKMNGCGHCEHLKPIWAEAVATIKKSNPAVVCIEVESAEIDKLDKDIKEKLKTAEIMGYPDLRILKKNGQVSKFDSNRTVEDLVKWIKENTDANSSAKKLRQRPPTPYPGKTRKVKGGRRSRRHRSLRRTRRRHRGRGRK